MALLMTLIVTIMALQIPQAEAASDHEVENLATFTRLYGYVRFFHPSDGAADLDWDTFAILGARRVRGAEDAEQLQSVLLDLFQPIAPTVQIFSTGDSPAPTVDTKFEGEIVAWQHSGVGLQAKAQGPYRSIRTGRSNPQPGPGASFGTVTQCFEAESLRGKEIRFSALLRVEASGRNNGGQLWLRVDRPEKKKGFFSNLGRWPVKPENWSRYQIEGKVDDDATNICFGGILKGQGRVWVDDAKLEVRNNGSFWTELPIQNPGFEEDRFRSPIGWYCTKDGYLIQSVAEGATEGERCIRMVSRSAVSTEKLFDRMPELGECVEQEIGGGLACRVPLALGDEQAKETGSGLEKMHQDLQGINEIPYSVMDPSQRLAGVVIAWNIFQHFYPYFDVVDTDWAGELTGFLSEADAAADGHAYYLTLRRLMAKLKDGHGGVRTRLEDDQGVLDFKVDRIEDQIAVVWVPAGSELQVGDVVITVDGADSGEMLKNEMDLCSGSKQWRCKKAAGRFGMGPLDTTAEVVVRRKGNDLNITVARKLQDRNSRDNGLEMIQEIEPGIWYVNLDKAEMDTISTVMPQLAAARGVIFDLRGYPKGNHHVIRHLMTQKETSDSWMQIPQTIYPDRRDVQWKPSRWQMDPQEPHIQGKVVFLTDGRAISYAESFMGFIAHYELAEIVGMPTAGANGNINPFTLPGGFTLYWTGMKVLKHDGSQHHTVGVTPTVWLEPTLEALVQGRDEYVEKALEIIEAAGAER